MKSFWVFLKKVSGRGWRANDSLRNASCNHKKNLLIFKAFLPRHCLSIPMYNFSSKFFHSWKMSYFIVFSLPADLLSFHLSSGLMEVISGPGMMKWSSFQKQQWAYCRGNVSFHSLTHSLNRLSCGTFIKRFYSLDCPRRRTMSYRVACCSPPVPFLLLQPTYTKPS